GPGTVGDVGGAAHLVGRLVVGQTHQGAKGLVAAHGNVVDIVGVHFAGRGAQNVAHVAPGKVRVGAEYQGGHARNGGSGRRGAVHVGVVTVGVVGLAVAFGLAAQKRRARTGMAVAEDAAAQIRGENRRAVVTVADAFAIIAVAAVLAAHAGDPHYRAGAAIAAGAALG